MRYFDLSSDLSRLEVCPTIQLWAMSRRPHKEPPDVGSVPAADVFPVPPEEVAVEDLLGGCCKFSEEYLVDGRPRSCRLLLAISAGCGNPAETGKGSE